MPVLLVIDDEPAILHAFRRGFQQADVTVLTAASAAEGLAMVTQHDPDVVLLDLALPDLLRSRRLPPHPSAQSQDPGHFYYWSRDD